MRWIFVLAMLIIFSPRTTVSVRVTDPSGEGLKDELIIVQDLGKHEHEVARLLTDRDGHVPEVMLDEGLYRVIAANPYGPWRTGVQEFLVKNEPVKLTVKVLPAATRGHGDVAIVPTAWSDLLVLQPDGVPASNAEVLARDEDATPYLERWYTTDDKGLTRIELVTQPITLTIIFDSNVLTPAFPRGEPHPVIHLPK
jgi:hypothetical protein